jgi:dephospho-CoA kinase
MVIDADAVAREVTDEPAVQAAIGAAFGPGVVGPGGRLDRSALAAVVFSDPSALRRLETLTHPRVRQRIEAAIAAAAAGHVRAVIIEAIKLLEGDLAAECDEVWLITCAPAVQASRLRARGVPDDDAARRIAAQGAIREHLAPLATRVLTTDASAETVERAARAAYAAALARDRTA